jgi:hypothetical protein
MERGKEVQKLAFAILEVRMFSIFSIHAHEENRTSPAESGSPLCYDKLVYFTNQKI